MSERRTRLRIRNPWAALAGLPGEVWLLCAATLVNRIGAMALIFLVLYLTDRGWSARDAGWVVSVFGVGSLVAAPLGGILCDRVGTRRVLIAALLFSGLILAIYPLFSNRALVFALTFLWALTADAFRPASYTFISQVTAPSQQRAAFAALRMAINVGASLGPAIGGFLARVSMPALFIVDGCTSLIAVLVLWLAGGRLRHRWRATAAAGGTVTRDSMAPEPAVLPPAARSRFSRFGMLAEPRFAGLVGGMLLLTTVFFLVMSALPLDLVRGQGMSETALGLLYTLNAVIVVVFEVPLVAYMSRWAAPRALAAGGVCIAAGVGATAFAHDFVTAAPTVVLWSLGEMLVFPAGSTYVSEITSHTRRGEAMGLYTGAFGAGFVLAPLLGTWALGRWGADAMWLGAFVVGLVAAAQLLRLDGRRREGVPSRA